jgi:hypothetical protein
MNNAGAQHHLQEYACANQVTTNRFARLLLDEPGNPEFVTLFHRWVSAAFGYQFAQLINRTTHQ